MRGIYVVDAQPCFVAGLRQILGATNDLVFAGCLPSASGAAEAVAASRASLVVVDVAMEDFEPEEFRTRMVDIVPWSRLLALTHSACAATVEKARSAGVAGYLLKTAQPPLLLSVVRRLLEGGVYFDPAVAARIGPDVRSGSDAFPEGVPNVSAREIEVLRRVAMGHSCKAIGQMLGISPKSAETYKARALHKLGLESRVDLVRFAGACGWFCTAC